jgi:hypothetical protein
MHACHGPHVPQKAMNIFRELIETEGAGLYLADAIHDGETIQSLRAFPISEDGIVEESLEYGMETLTDLAAAMQRHLTESLKE